MNLKKTVSIIAGIAVFGAFLGIVIHAETITDEKRFLITILSELTNTATGNSFEYPANPPNIDVHYVEMLPGAHSGWHTHDIPLIVTVMHGKVTINYCYNNGVNSTATEKCPDGQITKQYETGDSFVEAIDIQHNAINNMLIPAKMHIVSLNPPKDWQSIYEQ